MTNYDKNILSPIVKKALQYICNSTNLSAAYNEDEALQKMIERSKHTGNDLDTVASSLVEIYENNKKYTPESMKNIFEKGSEKMDKENKGNIYQFNPNNNQNTPIYEDDIDIPDFMKRIQYEKERERYSAERKARMQQYAPRKEEIKRNSTSSSTQRIKSKKKGDENTGKKILAGLVVVGLLFGAGMYTGAKIESNTHYFEYQQILDDSPVEKGVARFSDGTPMSPRDQQAQKDYYNAAEEAVSKLKEARESILDDLQQEKEEIEKERGR